MNLMWRRAAVLLVLCIALAVVASSQTLHDGLLRILRLMNEAISRHPLTGALLFVVLAAISAMFAFVSAAVLTPAAVFAWGEGTSLMLLWIGWILGGIGCYFVGRYLGRPAVRWLASDRTLDRFEHRVRGDVSFGSVLLLQLALPSEIPGYLLGLARYRFSTYFLALVLAELPYSFATVHLGASFLQHRSGLVLITGLAITALSITALYALRHAADGAGVPSKSLPHGGQG